MNSIKKNVFFKGLLTFSNYIIGFVTFPYITRVLGPSNFGLVNFALNTVDYFLLFASMGIATIGTREIAAVRSSKGELDNIFSKILGTNLLFTFFSLIIFSLCIFLIPKLYVNRELFLIGSVKILFTAFTVEWLYTGLENFKYITIRSLVVRIIYVICVFLFIKKPSDYIIYFSMTISVVIINALINFIYSRRFVTFSIKALRSLKYIRQNLRLGIYTIMTSMYITFNTMYLGLVSTDEQVGYYSTAVKLYFIALSMFSAFTSVMLPRIAALSAKNEINRINTYIHQSFQMVFLLAFPIVILSIVYAPQIILIMSGSGYDEAVVPMRILMPALLLVWFSQVIVFQCLIPGHHDKILLAASIIGGGLAIGINILFTPKLQSMGSALTLFLSEAIVTIFYIMVVKIRHIISLPNYRILWHNILLALPYLLICAISESLFNGLMSFVIGLGFSGIYFLIINPLKRVRN